MNDNEKLYNAITQIDGAFVDEAAGSYNKKRAPMYVRIIYAAAVLLLAAGAVFAVSRMIRPSAPQQEAALITEKPTKEPTAEPTESEGGPTQGNMPEHDPKPDPIVPDTNAHDLAMVIEEWFDKTGAVELRVYENESEKDRVTITERKELVPVTHALRECFEVLNDYTQGDDFTSLTTGIAERIDISGDGAAISIWDGLNYVRYQKGDFTRWLLLEGYSGQDHGEEFIFDELMRGSFADPSEARAETYDEKDAQAAYDLHDFTVVADGVLLMESPDEPGVYLPIVDRTEEFMQIFTETGKSGELLEFEECFTAARNERSLP